MKLLVITVFVACSFLPFSSGASAQSVLVRVNVAESGGPLPGAFVSLVDQNGLIVRSALTNESGQFVFPVSHPGSFHVTAEMIGRATQTSPPFSLRQGESHLASLSLPLHAITLAEIHVEADEQCRLSIDEASEISRVWDAARTSLRVQAWTEQEGVYRLDILTYDRDLDKSGRKVERENRQARTRVTRTPFRSLPPEDLMASGFVRSMEGGGYEYFGPDAILLLSDEFLSTHCFRLKRSRDHPASIGLAFEPVTAGERADIQGTLWLDEESGGLQSLDFRYTTAPWEEARGIAGGRVEFEVMPDGAWIIRQWWIRAPIMGRYANLARAGDSGIRVTGIRETGGEVLGVSTLSRERIAQAERGVLTGAVWDSTRSAPLEGATVFLSGTGYAAVTDNEGRFVLENLPAGVFTASFTHPRLDSLHIDAPGVEAEVTVGRTAELTLSIPSSGTILLAACRAEDPETAAGSVLSGIVTDRKSGEPIPGATVRLEWQEVVSTRPIVQARNQWFDVQADEKGRYTACGVPINAAVRIRPSLLRYTGDAIQVAFSEQSHQIVDLMIELPARSASAARIDPTSSSADVGVQGIQGLLTDRESGAPVQNAAITARRISGEIIASGVTSERGFFRLQAATPGRFLLSAEALGYDSLSGAAVDVAQGKLTVLEIQMVPAALELEPLVVTAEPRAFHLEMEGFYRRQLEGLGTFMPPELFEERRPRLVTDLLFGRPGINVAEPAGFAGGRAVYFRSGIRSRPEDTCWPMIYVNRHLVSTGGLSSAGAEPAAIDELVPAADVWAMEVYRSPAEIPPEFNGPNAGCGVIVLWTRRGGGD